MGFEFIDASITTYKVVIFSKTTCPSCKAAKNIFYKYVPDKLNDSNYKVVEIDKLDDCSKIQDYLQKLTGARTVPRVFINGKCIGGGDDTAALENAGKLKSML